jgi:hypothetical protein
MYCTWIVCIAEWHNCKASPSVNARIMHLMNIVFRQTLVLGNPNCPGKENISLLLLAFSTFILNIFLRLLNFSRERT